MKSIAFVVFLLAALTATAQTKPDGLVGEIEVYGAGWGFASGRVHCHEN
jgi:hypothetical protein